jgi:opacity protein-like surface antigen
VIDSGITETNAAQTFPVWTGSRTDSVSLAVLLAVLGCAAPVRAQTGPAPIGYIAFGSTALGASQTFNAVAGTDRDTGFTIGGSVVRLWRGVFADVAWSQQKITGQRVFVNQGTVYGLGIPLTITMRPLDLAGGWRVQSGRLSPYGGAGVSHLSYKETDPSAAAGETVDMSHVGPLLMGGVDFALLQWIQVGGEIRYRRVSGILGSGGVSQSFGEDTLGGVSLAVRVVVGR